MSASAPSVYLDSNVFIIALENATARSDHAWWILRAVQEGKIAGATSEVTLAEVLVKPIERQMPNLVTGYESMIANGPNFHVLPIKREILVDAARIRSVRASVKLPDAIHIATAQALRCSFFITEDDRLNVPEDMKRLPVSPHTLDLVKAEAK